ncbi:Transient receptor putative cation channel sub A member 1 [Phlyctochytrium bullatum]|nr:Transient receptor putative cation channel sub A member 1 [Phlyctochytrium bullatum]
MYGLKDAIEMVGLMKSLDLLDDLRRAFPFAIADDFNSHMWTTFFFASAKSGFREGLDLIPQGHSFLLTTTNEDDMTLLHVASTALHATAVELLLAKGAVVNPTGLGVMPPLFTALSDYNLKVLKVLLHHRTDVHHMYQNVTAVHKASSTNQHKALQLLLEYGANPGARSATGRPALFDPALSGHSECVLTLLNAGADVNVLDLKLRTPLMLACLGGHVDVVRILLERGANVNHASIDNCSPLHVAVTASGSRNKPGVVKALFFRSWISAMEIPKRATLLPVVTLLLEAGADTAIKSNPGLEPLSLFSVDVTWNTQRVELLERFIEIGADLQAKTKSGQTVWQKLCAAGREDPVLLQWVQRREGFD